MAGAVPTAVVVAAKQGILSLAWTVWGLAVGIVCDRSAWHSARFLTAAAASVAGALASSGGAASPLVLCSLSFLVGSRLRVVGLTGGIAVGKSSVSERLRELNIPVIDADQISHSVLKKGKPAHTKVLRAFAGHPGVVTQDGDINRRELRNLVFSDKRLNRVLKGCTHPAIRSEMLRQIARLSLWEGHPLVVLDSPLLFESGSAALCSRTLVVHCDEDKQVARLMRRDGCSEVEARGALSAQMPQKAKMARADACIPNDGTMEQLRERVDDVCRSLLDESRGHVLRAWRGGGGLPLAAAPS